MMMLVDVLLLFISLNYDLFDFCEWYDLISDFFCCLSIALVLICYSIHGNHLITKITVQTTAITAPSSRRVLQNDQTLETIWLVLILSELWFIWLYLNCDWLGCLNYDSFDFCDRNDLSIWRSSFLLIALIIVIFSYSQQSLNHKNHSSDNCHSPHHHHEGYCKTTRL